MAQRKAFDVSVSGVNKINYRSTNELKWAKAKRRIKNLPLPTFLFVLRGC